jgi:hypothetical protein
MCVDRERGGPEEDDELLDRSEGQRIGGLGLIEERYWEEWSRARDAGVVGFS